MSLKRCLFLSKDLGNESLVYKYTFQIFTLMFFVALFHAFTLVDYDWRYRFPILMPMLISVGFNLDYLLNKACCISNE